jgi:glycosyltransferase involved in cell wall biosynthesis
MIEAMACGTPVIASRCGSTPEVIDHGISGFLVNDLDEAVAAVHLAQRLDRREIRGVFERRFSIERVAADYLQVYMALCGMESLPARPPDGLPMTA